MASSKSRVGIERKILSTILWVCIFPIAVILVVGYIIARGGQTSAVQQALLSSAQKTAGGIQIELSARMRIAENLAADPYIVHQVSPYAEDKLYQPFAPLDQSTLKSWLDRYRKIDSSNPTAIALYDQERKLVLATTNAKAQGVLANNLPEGTKSAAYNSFRFEQENNVIAASVVAPIYSPTNDKLIGYLSVESQINSLLEYAMGAPIGDADLDAPRDNYQIAYIIGDSVVTVQGDINSSIDGIPELATIATHHKLEFYLIERPSFGSHSIRKYIMIDGVPKYNAMVAYQRLINITFANADIYLVVYRPSANVFSQINKSVILLTIGCILFIGILCINAYREVHNNIVRPVSLLNEGAQIVRQGDFDLKLKIGTGDEIEELAISFNKMAVALKSNIVQLEDSEEKYRHLVTALRDGIYQTDGQGKLTFINQAGLDIFGFLSVDYALDTQIKDFFRSDVDFD